jgi:ATP-dependent exoDNAse (exonuclease V) beta subunit
VRLQRLRVSDDLPGGAMSAVAVAPFTSEQRAAISQRTGSSLLAANAGSGKTAVIVERFAEAVLDDGVPVGAILALTFTEKAAAELRERVRACFTALGRGEEARAVDASWIGTIHGFCARVLRSAPLAAGLDPRFAVLDEAAARRLAERAFERALDDWVAAEGAPAVDLAAAYGQTLRSMVLAAHATLRSRGQTRPSITTDSQATGPHPDPGSGGAERAALEAARAGAAAALVGCAPGRKVSDALAALQACERLLAAGEVPLPGDLAAAKLGNGARGLDAPECAEYREAWTEFRAACADHHARPALALAARLLDTFAAAYAEAKAARARVDFEDLELGVRDLLAGDEPLRRRWAERFELIMVDEFQDTNRLQLDVLRSLERDNLFAVGDEFQSIYAFRHADVTIFRERRAELGEEGVRGLSVNFRSREELLDVVNAAFAPIFGETFQPLVAGRAEPPGRAAADELRLFDPDGPPDEPAVELLVCESGDWEGHDTGLSALATQPSRRVEARLLAHRLREEVSGGRRPGDIVVLVRATASLRLLEQALEDQGLPTYVVGGRGYWSQEQVRDGLAYLAALANPLDEEALYGTLASPFCGAGSDALVLLAEAGRVSGIGAWGALRAATSDALHSTRWLEDVPREDAERLRAFARFFAAERVHAERLAVEVLLERAVAATGYDLAVLARAGGDRRMANLRKLMRLAREYERAEGRDLRGFLAYAAGQDLVSAREGEAPLGSEGLDAIRLMTIHRAKGLEFPVVCVADLGRPTGVQHERLLIGRDGSAGLRLATLAGGDAIPALGWDRIAAELDAEDAEEERRLLYVAATRAEERLILSGTTALDAWPAARAGGPPADWLVPALVGDPLTALQAPERTLLREWDGREARVRVRVATPETLDALGLRGALAPAGPGPRSSGRGTALPAEPKVVPRAASTAAPQAPRLSYSALTAYAKCPYRFYLERTLRLPRETPPPRPPQVAAPEVAAREGSAPEVAPPEVAASERGGSGLDLRTRGSIVHVLLEDLDFARPAPPDAGTVTTLGADYGVELTEAEVADIQGLVTAFAASPLCSRLAAASRPRREAPFSFALEPGGNGPLVTGFVDVLARTPDGGALIVDYKTDRLDGASPAELVERDYATQRSVYALAALSDGAPTVEVAYCFLETPGEPVGRTFTQRDSPALAERILQLAKGVLQAEYPVTGTPHRDLCEDCPGRPALCSYDESMTLRDYPDEDTVGAP